VLDVIEARKDRPVYLNYCDCKSLNGQCGKPRDTCITYKDGINTYVHRGLGKRIDAETAKEVVRRADRAGLMHTVNPTGICNCCDDCCYLFRSQKRRKSGGFWLKTDHVISWDQEKCVGCGLCKKRCRFQVFSGEKKELCLDFSRCVGCGLCASACPGGALELVARCVPSVEIS
ncbi:MAG: 4Fe-4S binding protein, partial [Lachnospiraceae bacterium]|nr:4Fe-4S binding protein [Lachnospiraceae bacterium]